MWNASHLAVRLCALRHWKRVSMPPTTQSLHHPLTRAIHFAPRIKTARRFTAPPPDDNMVSWKEVVSNLPKRFCMVGTRHFASAPCKIVLEGLIHPPSKKSCYHQGFFAVKRRAVFILLAMPPPSPARAALVMWCGRFKLQLEIRHATALTTGAKHWHR